jgi:UDP-GlcNAc:undecaprenyl-phosphate GlcNAc-1-phosphate transferase
MINLKIFIYFIITFLIIFLITKTSYRLNLLDIPGERKNHSKPTAYTGGISLGLVYMVSIFLLDLTDNNLNQILSLATLIAIVGLIDDRYELNIGGKLSLQIFPIIYMIVLEKINLNHLGDYYYFKLELGSFSIPFTLLSVLFLINAFNYFDGLDGTLSFTTLSVMGILFFLYNDKEFWLYLITIIIPIFLFLLFNFSILRLPKLFLGDNGSLLLGFIVGFILIYLAKKEFVHPILLAWSVSIFVYEFISINIIRLKKRKNVFKPGHDHLHNILLEKTNSIFLTNFLIFTNNVIFFIFGYLSFMLINPITSFILFIFLFIFYTSFRIKLARNF